MIITQDNINTLPSEYLMQFFDGTHHHFLTTQQEVSEFQSKFMPVIVDGVIIEGATEEQIFESDPKRQPDYYKIRAEAGQKLVNDITNKLLLELKSGVRSLADTMLIESKLESVISSLNFGQLITAKVKVSQVGGIDTALLNEIKSSIDELNVIHYA